MPGLLLFLYILIFVVVIKIVLAVLSVVFQVLLVIIFWVIPKAVSLFRRLLFGPSKRKSRTMA